VVGLSGGGSDDPGRGTRVILNDKDPENEQIPRAIGINLNRNQGWEGLDITEMVNSYEV